jgi:hypothetical protein
MERVVKMVNFEDFFEIPEKLLKAIGVVLDPKPPVSMREKLKYWARELYFLFSLKVLVIFFILTTIFLYQNFNDLFETESAWSNFFGLIVLVFKALYMRVHIKRIHELMMKLKVLFKNSRLKHSERYNRTFRICHALQKAYSVNLSCE